MVQPRRIGVSPLLLATAAGPAMATGAGPEPNEAAVLTFDDQYCRAYCDLLPSSHRFLEFKRFLLPGHIKMKWQEYNAVTITSQWRETAANVRACIYAFSRPNCELSLRVLLSVGHLFQVLLIMSLSARRSPAYLSRARFSRYFFVRDRAIDSLHLSSEDHIASYQY